MCYHVSGISKGPGLLLAPCQVLAAFLALSRPALHREQGQLGAKVLCVRLGWCLASAVAEGDCTKPGILANVKLFSLQVRENILIL